MAAQRQQQIVSAFIELVAKWGLESVGLADVAAAANVQQAAIRHFVGNRDQLVVAAIEELNRRFSEEFHANLAAVSDAGVEIRRLFRLPAEESVDARAFAALEPEGERSPRTRTAIRESYQLSIDLIAAVLRRSYPEASEQRIRDAAYNIKCLSETNADLQRLGFPAARGNGAADAALAIVERLAEG